MKYQESLPSAHLAGFVKCYWAIEDLANTGGEPEPIVPDGCCEIVFDLADRFKRIDSSGASETQPVTIVAGQLKRGILIQATGRINLFGVRFLPNGAFPFFDVALYDLTDKTENIDSIWGREGIEIEEQIYGADSFEERIRIIERILTRKLCISKRANTSATEAVRYITKAGGNISIRNVARHAGVGERKLEREFNEKIGISPKTFSRIIRFQMLLRSLESSGLASLADKALDLGYYDQAHMVHEFNRFTGKSPYNFFKDTHQISEVFTAN